MLIVMGAMILRGLRKARLDLSPARKGQGMNLVLTGILGSLSNPYWIIWWATIGLGYLISSMTYGIAGIVVFFIGHISADLAWYSLVSFAVARGRTLMGDKGYRLILLLCGIFLISFGAWFINAA
jgi:threonine/homoserine/homoserine lactone efflux protein